jgi:hypothetical protein
LLINKLRNLRVFTLTDYLAVHTTPVRSSQS